MVEVSSAQLNQRLDNFLLKILDNVPRTRIYRIIRKGEVRVNKKRSKPDYKLQLGDQVRIPPMRVQGKDRPEIKLPTKRLEELRQAIIYETDHLLVLDKPAGLAVHSGSGIHFGVIDLVRELRPDDDIELVHRLDRDTSGCLLLSKHRQALLCMQGCLQDNSLKKRYCAVVKGRWPEQTREIRHALNKTRLSNGERRIYIDENGKSALSLVELLQQNELYSVIRVEIVTGRTHQIRVHCQAEGHEIAGDDKYGDAEFNRSMRQRNIRRLMLHAASLELPPSEYSQEVVINAALPAEFERLLDSNTEPFNSNPRETK